MSRFAAAATVGIAVAALLVAVGVSVAAPSPDRSAHAPARIPFRITRGLIMVDGSLENRGPFTWIVDTGASQTLVTPGCLAKVLPERQAPLAARMQTYTAQSICAGDGCVTRLPVAVLDPPQAAPLRLDHGMDYHGLLGYTFLSRFTPTFDYPNGVLVLAPPSPAGHRSAPEGTNEIPFRLINHLVHAPVRVGSSEPLMMIVDTGAAENLILPQAAERVGMASEPTTLPGVRRAVAPECRIGGQTVSNVSFVVHRLVREGMGTLDYDGILGTPFLSGFAVTIDYRRSTIRLTRPGALTIR